MQEIIQEIRDEIEKLSWKNRRSRIKYYAGELRISEKTLYRRLKNNGNGSGRKRRSDADCRKILITDEQFWQVAGLIFPSWSKKYKRPKMPYWRAIQIAENQGIIPKRILSIGTLSRWLNQMGMAKNQVGKRSRHRQMESNYPNEVHQFDTSNCSQWYLDGEKIKYQPGYKGKNPERKCIKRFVLTDHLTGAFFIWYALDETIGNCLEFLFRAWGRKEKNNGAEFIFRGIPKILYTDNGILIRSHIGKTVMENLGINFITHLPEQAQATGTVEKHQDIWERAFESELSLNPAKTLEELNERAFRFALYYQTERRHTRHGMTRFEAWSKIQKDELKELPDDINKVRALAMIGREKRLISYGGIIKYRGAQYYCADDKLWGKQVLVGPDVFEVEKDKIIVVDGDKKYKIEKRELNKWGYGKDTVRWGDFKGIADNKTEKNLKIMGERSGKTDMRLNPIEITNQVANVPGTQIEIGNDGRNGIDEIYDKLGAKKLIVENLGYTPLKWQWNLISAMMGDKEVFKREEIDQIISRINIKEEKYG